MHLQDALQGYLRQLAADGRSTHTIGQYHRHGSALLTWLDAHGASLDAADLTPDLLARFFASDAARNRKGGGAKKATSTNAMRTSIRCFAAHLHAAGLIAANPARLLRRARCTPPPPRPLHEDEQARLRALLAAAPDAEGQRDRMLLELLLGSGIRIGSALALDVGDLDLSHGEITLRTGKNNRPTTALIPQGLAEQLQQFVAGRTAGPLFLARGRRLSTRQAQRRIGIWLRRAGIQGRSAHAMRHTFATLLLARTGDLRLVQAALNHASIASTTIYAQVDRARLRAAVGR
ncbi:MAG: tyrosine-type recombinase/integrase [Planctomycetes bacterium]|nr:tyrosine-type recombinase/integrase [Planctomycetota bacterium]